MTNKPLALIGAVAFCVAMAVNVLAQTTMPATTPQPAATPPGESDSLNQALNTIDASMSREEIEALVKRANENRLKSERQMVAVEVKDKLYEDDVTEAALALLTKDAANTQVDNIERICQAYAKVDPRFANLYKLFGEKKYAEAAVAGKALVNTQSSFLGAARAYVYAMSLELDGKVDDAGDAYKDLLDNMYDRISFASESAMRVAKLYDKQGRGMYALEMYTFALKNYGPTMDQKQFDEVVAKVRQLSEMYKDPLGTAATMMSDVKERLARKDSGETTQDKEKKILAMLDDLIKTSEDQQASSSSSSSQNKKDKGPKDGQGQKPGEGTAKGTGNAANPNPSNPAQVSALRGGDTTRAGKLSDVHQSKENGDWSSLPPEQQQKLEQLRQRMVNERYRDIISDYHKRIAEEK